MIIKVPNGDESEEGGCGCDNQWYDSHAQRPGVQHRQEIVDISQGLQVQNGVVRTKHGTQVEGEKPKGQPAISCEGSWLSGLTFPSSWSV